ncbi:MAG TPA: hypothetical protein ENJ64_05685, partial [Thiotrichales bacterium]|nr:hypothetical protein [Thiotrichales bacterium]
MVQPVKDNSNDRVNLVYKTRVAGSEQEIELPLRLLVLSDLTADERSAYLDEQEPVAITDSALQGVFAKLKPEMKLRVKNRLTDDGELLIHYPLSSLDDFLPENIVKHSAALSDVVAFIDALSEAVQSGS